MNRFKELAIALGLMLLPSLASADLIVTISSGTGAVGSDIFLHVMVRSDATMDAFSNFTLSYVINAPGLVFFTDSLGEPDQSFLSNPSYVFYGNSQALDSGTNVGTVSSLGDTYSESDATLNSMSTQITSTGYLLGTLRVVGATAGSYSISLDLGSGTSGFVDISGPTVVPFTSNSGIVTVTGSSTIPEPSSLSILIIGTVILGWSFRPHRS